MEVKDAEKFERMLEDLDDYVREETYGSYGTDEIFFLEDSAVALISYHEDVEAAREKASLAEKQRNLMDEHGLESINTSVSVYENLNGESAVAIFQPYTEQADSEYANRLEADAVSKGLWLDSEEGNFRIQYNSRGVEIRRGFADFGDKISVFKIEQER